MAAGDNRLIVFRSRLGVLGLIGPGTLWLALFFVVPMVFMGVVSLESGSIDEGFVFDWSFGNYADAISTYQTQFLRSFGYGAAATALALLIAYPLAYAIAFRVGRWKSLFLFAVVRERAYVWYVAYLGAWVLFQASLSGHAAMYLWPDAPAWADVAPARVSDDLEPGGKVATSIVAVPTPRHRFAC